jgi:hypothetical protein
VNSDSEEFMKQMSDSYGRMETVLGADAYQVFLTNQLAEQERMKGLADREKAIASLYRIITLVILMASVPVIVFLWKWALS